MSDVFTVELPWGLPKDSPIQVNEIELPLVLLMEHIIDDLQFKLSQRTAKADEALRAKYRALLDEREEIISSRDRALAGAEVMRKKRNEAEREARELSDLNQQLLVEKRSLEDEVKRLSNELRHAKDEISGIPKLVENKVAAAMAERSFSSAEVEELKKQVSSLSEQLAISENKRQKTAAINSSLDMENKAVKAELLEANQHISMLSELLGGQTEQIKSMEEGLKNADQNYRYIMHNIDELLAYSAIITHENEELRNDNLYLSEAVQLHDLKTVWKGGKWQAFMLCKSSAIRPQEGLGTPDPRFGLMYLMNVNTGVGHTAYIDNEGELCFSKHIPESCLLDEKYREEFAEAARKIPVEQIEVAIERAVKRTKKVVSVAKLLDLEWCSQVSLVSIAQRLNDYIPQSELVRVLTHIERAKDLAPRNDALIKRINKRFNTEYALCSAGGRIPDRPAKAARKVGKPKRDRKRA